jgi:hypothetical protein
MRRRTYPVCTWLPTTFAVLFIGGCMIAVAVENGVASDLLVNLAATMVGVFVALLLERAVERRKDEEERQERLASWLSVIEQAAKANLGLVRQMITVELATQHACVPTYRTDRILAAALEHGARELVAKPSLVEVHRHAVFELSHLDNKLTVLLMLLHNPGAFFAERASTIKIAQNAEAALVALEAKCCQVMASLPARLVES